MRGPAIEPSLVTWPTSTVAMSRSLATRISAAATSRTWVTPPAGALDLALSDGLHRVDHEQVGLDRLDVPEDGGEVGLGGEAAASGRSAPIRSARSRTWPADSSPVT